MKNLKVEVNPLDILAMLPSIGMMAENREETEAVGRVVAGALCGLVTAYPEAAQHLSDNMLSLAIKREENSPAVDVIKRALDIAVEKGFLIPLE